MNDHGEPGKPGGEGKGPWGGVGGEGGAGGAGPGGGPGGGGGTGGAGGTVGQRLHPRRAALLTWFWLTVITGLTAWALLSFGETQGDVEDQADRIEDVARQIQAEAIKRRHQNCVTFERDQQADIRTLRDERENYRELLRYVEDIPPGERDTQLNRAIIRSIPEQRDDLALQRGEVMSSRPPAYCDKPGVGLENGDGGRESG